MFLANLPRYMEPKETSAAGFQGSNGPSHLDHHPGRLTGTLQGPYRDLTGEPRCSTPDLAVNACTCAVLHEPSGHYLFNLISTENGHALDPVVIASLVPYSCQLLDIESIVSGIALK